ncbi:MAG TPA: ParA family protein [Leptolyngbyaceae cyanobacterium]
MQTPQILAFVNQKGGVGKSTGAVHAADHFARKGKSVILVDADAQQSSSQWAAELKETYPQLKLSSLAIINPEDLFDKLPNLAQEYDLVVVDGPAKSNEITKAILARCHLALIPCRESIVELRSSGDILRLIRQVRELRGDLPKAAIYMTQVKSNTVLLKEAQDALGDEPDIPLMRTIIYDRQVFKDAPGQANTVFGMSGRPAKDAAKLYDTLFTEALKIFNGKQR